MALPHLKTNTYLHKSSYEHNLSKRRNFDEECLQQWNNNVKYFQLSNVRANKVNQWSSEKSFNTSIGAYNKQLCSIKHNNLLIRKAKLADLYDSERQEYQKELETRLLIDGSNISILKNRSETLKSAREQERRNHAEKLYQEHFRLNNPYLRDVEREINNKEMTDYWPLQIHEKTEEEMKVKEDDRKYQELESIRLDIRRAEERDNFHKKVLQERYMKDSLRRQIEEMKLKEEESQILKDKEAELLRVEKEIDDFYHRRKLINDANSRKVYGRALQRQHAAVMRRKSKQIQEELESDIQFLNYLSNKNEEENEIQTARKQTARQDIEWMRGVVEDQLRKERERENELNSIFAEEAAKLWEKREKEWEKEKMAREKLMEEVLNERKIQMQQKVKETRDRQTESLLEREKMLEEMELDRYNLVKESESARQRKSELRSNLDYQINTKKQKQINENYKRQNEIDEELGAEKAFEELLAEEAKIMRDLGITPRSARR